MKEKDFFKKEYWELLPLWQQMENSYKGSRAIKKHDLELFEGNVGDKDLFNFYLPPLAGMLTDYQSKKHYYRYLNYAIWFAAYRRTIDTYVNLLNAKKAVIEAPEEVKEKATIDGTSLLDFLKSTEKEVLLKNRCGILIDAPNAEEDKRVFTIQDSKDNERRPFLALYKAESIVDWSANGDYVVLFESTAEVTVNEEGYKQEVNIQQFRILEINKQGIYRQRLVRFEGEGEDQKLVLVFDILPVINGSTLDYIPFYPVTDKGITWKYSGPFTEDISILNIGHFRNSASYESSLKLTANPTVVIKGSLSDEQIRGDKSTPPRQLKIGTGAVIRLLTDGDAKFLEYTGSGVEPQIKAMQSKENLMARLGADVIEDGKKGVESSKTVELKSKGENSLLSALSISLSESFTIILVDAYGEGSSVTLNKDFNLSSMPAQYLTALGLELSSAHISWLTYFENLVKGEIIPEGITAEEEEKRILEDQTRFREVEGGNGLNGEGGSGSSGEVGEGTNEVTLNGTMAIIKAITAGELTLEAAKGLLQVLFNLTPDKVDLMLAGIKEGSKEE